MARPILEIANLSHHYGHPDSGIENINLTVANGEYLVLAGANGSGKTTLIRHMNGLLEPDSGEIRLHGKDIFNNLVHTRQSIGMVFQDADTQIVGETVFSEVAFGPENLRLCRAEIDDRVQRILKQFGLDRFSQRHPGALSGGEKRKLTIAGILVMDPEIIIFDEPFANLDYCTAENLAQLLRQLNQEGKTIIMASHDLDLIIGDAHRMMIMEKGKIAAIGSVQDLAPYLTHYGLKPLCTCKASENDVHL
ncbi:MAG: ABC transporter ATP-binding protein [Gammaproteobacteria bacterium]|nr:MAG: ABC transporter ATP-binding protein [Gammaproteobacteria bacterium]